MISGIDLNATVNYTLKDDKENPTIWKLGVIPSYLLGQLSAEVGGADQIKMAFKLLQLSIKGWENFNGIEYKTEKENFFGKEIDVISIDLLSRIPLKSITELSAKVLEINNLSVPEQKN